MPDQFLRNHPIEVELSKFTSVLFGGMLAFTGILIAVTGVLIAEYRMLVNAGLSGRPLERYKGYTQYAASLAIACALMTIALLVSLALEYFSLFPTEGVVALFSLLTVIILICTVAIISLAAFRLN